MISSVFCRFIFRIYIFSCRTVLPPSEILSSCRSDGLYVNSFVIVTTYFMEQTGTIQSVDTGFIYAVFKLSFSKQYKIQCFNQGCGSGSWKRKRWKRSIFCGSGRAKILLLPLPHRLFDLETNLPKKFCPFPNVD